jgi:hypothetical protein
MRGFVSILAALALASCSKPTVPARSRAAPFPLEARIGHVVTVEGIPEDAKLGALLMIGGSQTIWIDGLNEWPPELRDKVLEVTGKVIQRSDLPVFVHQDGEPERAGIPVGPGTDFEQARRRFLLAEARWKVVE